MSPTLQAHFADYATFHGRPAKRATYVAVPYRPNLFARWRRWSS